MKTSCKVCVFSGTRKQLALLVIPLSAIVISMTLYTRQLRHDSFLPYAYQIKNFTLEDEMQHYVEYLTKDKLSDCFHSPYVICAPYTKLDEWKPGKFVKTPETNTQNHDVRTNATVLPVLVTSLVEYGDSYEGLKRFNFSICSLPCAHTSRDRLREAKGVIVDGRFVKDKDLPETRSKGQVYVVTVLESPYHYQGTLLKSYSKHRDQINLTMTYRVDSNIHYFYGGLCLKDAPRKSKGQLKKIFERKSRTAAWFVSNCKTPSKRMAYVKKLQKYIDVDIFGKCGKKTYQKFGSEKQLLNDTYKFYLSFENSFCKDYVTEKFFKLFAPDLHIVPVVRGGMDYEKYFPPFTFINAGGFKTPLDLGNYLKDVGGDFEKYVKFLEGMDKYTAQPYRYRFTNRICNLCSVLHMTGPEVTSRYSDIGQWLSKDMCR